MRRHVSSTLVVLMGILPLTEAAHLVAHGHRQCPTHHTIEEGAPLAWTGACAVDAPLVVLGAPPAGRHTACPLLSYDAARKRWVVVRLSSPLPAPEHAPVTTAPRDRVRPAVAALILTAPKTSPPHAA